MAQLVEYVTFDLGVVNSSPTLGADYLKIKCLRKIKRIPQRKEKKKKNNYNDN